MCLMLGLHRTPEGLGTDLQPKNDQTHGYSGVVGQGRMFLFCYSLEGHKLLLNIRNNSGLLSTEIDKLHGRFNHQKQSWDLSISLASDPTRSWILLWSQVFANRSLITVWSRMSFGTIINRSQVTLEIPCKLLPSQTGNSRRSHPGRGSVANRSQSITDQSDGWRSGRGCDSGARVYADRLTNGVRRSRARKSVVVRSQVTLITWPIKHFLFPRMSVALQHRCKR